MILGMIFDWLYHIFPGTDPTPAPYSISPPSSGDGPLPSPPVQNLSRVRKPSLHVGLEAARLTILKHGQILTNPPTRWGFRLGQLYMVDFPASHVYHTAGHVRQKSETSRNPAALKQQSPSNWGFPKKRDAPVSIHIKTCPSAHHWGLLWLRKASSLNFPLLSHQHPSTSLKCPRTIVHLGLIHSLLCSTSEFRVSLEFCEVQALLLIKPDSITS